MSNDAVLPVDLRPLAYRWLSGLFADAPVQKTLEGFADAAGRTLINALADNPVFRPLVEAIRGTATDAKTRHIRAVDLAVSYGRLFLGAAGPDSPRPVQSAYVARGTAQEQEPARAMEDLLQALDFGRADAGQTPPDHIAVQMDVMAELAARFAHAWTEGRHAEEQDLRQRQIVFIEDHLLSWLPQFRADCAIIDDVGFYATALGVTEAFIEQDRNWLASGGPHA